MLQQFCSTGIQKFSQISIKQSDLAVLFFFLNFLFFISYPLQLHENFTNQIVTHDETWIRHFATRSKLQLLEWNHTSSSKKQKLKTKRSLRKIVCTVFWGRKGSCVMNVVPSVKISSYCDTLTTLRSIIQNRQWLLIDYVCFF